MNWLRRHQRWVLYIILIVFVLMIPVSYYGGQMSGRMDIVAEVNDEKIPFSRFNTLYNQAQTAKRDNNEEVSDEELKKTQQEVIQGLIQESVFHQEADRYGFQVSDQELAQNLANIPAFQKDGKFSGQAYNTMLRSVIKTTPVEFEESHRRQMVIRYLQQFVMRSIKITDREIEMEMALRKAGKPSPEKSSSEPEELREELAQEKGAHILNRWYQELGNNIKFKVYLDESGRQQG